jgi:hypothetical protein
MNQLCKRQSASPLDWSNWQHSNVPYIMQSSLHSYCCSSWALIWRLCIHFQLEFMWHNFYNINFCSRSHYMCVSLFWTALDKKCSAMQFHRIQFETLISTETYIAVFITVKLFCTSSAFETESLNNLRNSYLIYKLTCNIQNCALRIRPWRIGSYTLIIWFIRLSSCRDAENTIWKRCLQTSMQTQLNIPAQ